MKGILLVILLLLIIPIQTESQSPKREEIAFFGIAVEDGYYIYVQSVLEENGESQYQSYLIKLNLEGNLESSILVLENNYYVYFPSIYQYPNGDILLLLVELVEPDNTSYNRLLRFNSLGEVIYNKTTLVTDEKYTRILPPRTGFTDPQLISPDYPNFKISKIQDDGTIVEEFTLPAPDYSISHLVQYQDYYAIIGVENTIEDEQISYMVFEPTNGTEIQSSTYLMPSIRILSVNPSDNCFWVFGVDDTKAGTAIVLREPKFGNLDSTVEIVYTDEVPHYSLHLVETDNGALLIGSDREDGSYTKHISHQGGVSAASFIDEKITDDYASYFITNAIPAHDGALLLGSDRTLPSSSIDAYAIKLSSTGEVEWESRFSTDGESSVSHYTTSSRFKIALSITPTIIAMVILVGKSTKSIGKK